MKNCRPLELKTSAVLALAFVLSACGVKGDPLPPEKPSELGRGRPTYKRATEGIKVERKQYPADDDDERDEERDEE